MKWPQMSPFWSCLFGDHGYGSLVEQFRIPELDGTQGRIRSLTLGTDGALYATTDNGGDDRVLRVTPR